MKMFLVGMCDIFLLLYLTAVSQLEQRPVSKLTVADYKQLKEMHEQVTSRQSLTEKDLAERLNQLSRAEKRLKDSELLAKKLVEEKSSFEVKQKELTKQLAKEQRLLKEKEISEKTKLEEAKKLNELLKENEQRIRELQQREELAKAETKRELEEKTKIAAKAGEFEKAALEALQAKENAQREATEQKRRQEEAQAAREQALKEAAQAKESAELAIKQANLARDAQRNAESEAGRARFWATTASQLRQQAEEEAQLARLKEQEAIKEQRSAQQKVAVITQSAKQAYQKNVRVRTKAVDIKLVQAGLIGSSEEKKRLFGVPVKVGAESVMFSLVAQTGLLEISEPDDLLSTSFTVENQRISKVYLSNKRPLVLALVIPGGTEATELLPTSSFKEYMPVLLAIRNGSPRGFSDRIRDLDEEYFMFQRDRLREVAGQGLVYNMHGLRGTGDYAERLLVGDQILDLEGKFVGVVVKENTVLPIKDLSGWKSLLVDEPEKLVSEIIKRK